MLRWMEIKSDDRLQLFSKFGIVANLQGSRQVRLEAVFAPDTAHARFAESRRLRYRSRAPVGCIASFLLGGFADDFLHFYGCDARCAAATRSVLFQTG